MLLLTAYFLILTVAVFFLLSRCARLASQKKSFRIYAICFGVLLGYLSAEAVATLYARIRWTGTSLFLFEESGKTIHFDPVRGYRLTTEPSPWTRITNGTVEYIGRLQGNSEGFPSHNDFTAQRHQGITKRVAVFGDSFSAGEYLNTNWPDRAQAMAQANGDHLELLNFSVDGAGLANWWSILTRYIEPERYDLDGIIFVVFEANLERKFVVAEHGGYKRHMFGRCDNWAPSTYPTTLDDAKACMRAVDGAYIVSTGEFDQSLHGRWPSSVPRPPLRPVLAKLLLESAERRAQAAGILSSGPARQFTSFDPDQKGLIDDIHRFASSHNVPILVIFLPSRDKLTSGTWENDTFRDETVAFAKIIGGTFVDGAGAFSKMEPAAIRAGFLPYDYHWNQTGSDRFAGFMLEQIKSRFQQPSRDHGS
jgi:hypothetical protein